MHPNSFDVELFELNMKSLLFTLVLPVIVLLTKITGHNTSFSYFSSSMAIIYTVFSASNLIAPSVIAVVGPQLSLFFSGLVYR